MSDKPMGRLEIAFATQTWFSDPMVLPVEVVDSEQEVMAEVGVSSWAETQIDLPPGDYQVRGLLPSGSYLQTSTRVSSGDLTRVSLTQRNSPHEWLAAPMLAGEVPDYATYQSEFKRLRARPEVWVRCWTRSGAAWTPRPWPVGAWLNSDGIFWALDLPELPGPALHAVQIGGMRAAWRSIVVPPGPRSTVIIRPDGEEVSYERGLQVSLHSQHGSADAVLRYLTAGLQASAKAATDVLIDRAEQMLYEKRDDPLAAAAGGYLLLRTSEMGRLHHWPANFADWMDWFPDTAVIRGMQLLKESGPSPEAAEMMIRASETGPPVFTEGLRMLHEGHEWLHAEGEATDHDSRLAAARVRVRDWLGAADATQPFTTTFGEAPGRPSAASRQGVPTNTQGLHFLPDGIPRLGTHASFPLESEPTGLEASGRDLLQVIPTPDGWLVDGVEKPYEARSFRTKKAAIAAAREGIMRDSRLVLRRKDGSTQRILGFNAPHLLEED